MTEQQKASMMSGWQISAKVLCYLQVWALSRKTPMMEMQNYASRLPPDQQWPQAHWLSEVVDWA